MFKITIISGLLWAGSGSVPVYDVVVSPDSRDNFINGFQREAASQVAPYAELRPKPFIYSSDYLVDKKNAFVVAGVNPSNRLRQIRTLTGVTFESLDRRMLGASQRPAGRGLASSDRAWQGTGNVGIRRSNSGFLGVSEGLRERLIRDNDYVLSRGLTHQRVAEPLVMALEAHEKLQGDSEFEFQGKRYRVKGTKMAADSFVYDLLKKDDPRRTNRSGWIGFGMQGSPFHDEIFANWYFEISQGAKTLQGDALTVQLIYRYGFYQGGKFRMEPAAIVSMFNLQEGAPASQ